jgi:hypothetical protein
MFILQLAGAAITTSDDNSTINTGLKIYTAGVALQQIFIFCFIGLSIVFTRRLARECDSEKQKRVRPLLYTIYLSLTLISVRITHYPGDILMRGASTERFLPISAVVPCYLPHH